MPVFYATASGTIFTALTVAADSTLMAGATKVSACLPGLTRAHPIAMGSPLHVLVQERSESSTVLYDAGCGPWMPRGVRQYPL
jgi:hypothetical protein